MALATILLEVLACVKFFGAVKNYVHTISLTNGWNLTKLAQVQHQDGRDKRLDFGDIDLYRGIHYFSYFCSKNILWVFVRTASTI